MASRPNASFLSPMRARRSSSRANAKVKTNRAPRVVARASKFTKRPFADDPSTSSSSSEERRRASLAESPFGAGPGDVGANGNAHQMNIKVIPVERTTFRGVARARDARADIRAPVFALVLGDVVALLLFALVGRMTHDEGIAFADVVATASPFAIGWFASARVAGAYDARARAAGLVESAAIASQTWAIGVPIGIALRALQKGQAPSLAFVLVAMGATAAALVGWRSAYADAREKRAKALANTNAKGNALEFMGLLFSLVKRW